MSGVFDVLDDLFSADGRVFIDNLIDDHGRRAVDLVVSKGLVFRDMDDRVRLNKRGLRFYLTAIERARKRQAPQEWG
jgi:hypothetical protein